MSCGHFCNYFGLRKSPLIPRMGGQESGEIGSMGAVTEGGSCEEGHLLPGRGQSCPLRQKGRRGSPGGVCCGAPCEELGCEWPGGFREVSRKHLMRGMKDFAGTAVCSR